MRLFFFVALFSSSVFAEPAVFSDNPVHPARALDFGVNAVGSASSQTLIVSYTGQYRAAIEKVELASASPAFVLESIGSNSGSIFNPLLDCAVKEALERGNVCRMAVTFKPTSSGRFSAFIKMTYSFHNGTSLVRRILSREVKGATGVDAGWTKLTGSPASTGRRRPSLMSFGQELIVLGGERSSDVWGSADGVDWTPKTLNAGFGKATYHRGIVFNNALFVVSLWGWDGSQPGVFRSDDAITFTKISQTTLPSREGFCLVEHDGRMVLIGGYGSGGFGTTGAKFNSDLWTSVDGVTWTPVNKVNTFPNRTNHSCLSYNNRLYVIGGSGDRIEFRDVWSSTDGVSWTQENANYAEDFSGDTRHHNAFVSNGKMWISVRGTLFSSVDGRTWTATPDLDRKQWEASSMATHGTKLYHYNVPASGATPGTYVNEVWSAPLP